MTDRAHAEADQVVGRQLRQHFAIDIVVAECRRVLFEPQPAKPRCYVHAVIPGSALAADALHADARAFAQEEDLVREELGFRELGLAAERDEPLSETALEFLDHPS